MVRVKLYSAIFTKTLWDDFDKFLARIPDDVRPNRETILRKTEKLRLKGDGRKGVKITPEDSIWLIYSNLPEAFKIIRESVRCYHDEIVQRRDSRRVSVNQLLSKPRWA